LVRSRIVFGSRGKGSTWNAIGFYLEPKMVLQRVFLLRWEKQLLKAHFKKRRRILTAFFQRLNNGFNQIKELDFKALHTINQTLVNTTGQLRTCTNKPL
jgi:hypothetical protein